MARIGAIFNPYTHTPDEFRDAVLVAEREGLPELWIWEDCFRTSAFASAAAALAWTERLRIGRPLRAVATDPHPLEPSLKHAFKIRLSG